jgi:hypothetical protein
MMVIISSILMVDKKSRSHERKEEVKHGSLAVWRRRKGMEIHSTSPPPCVDLVYLLLLL